ncbi:uncharacterized protein LOC119152925 [Falco rusticolus]|uniref:uncharacterized protein LOC119152925 n=1 Tax=Falco rusticolus TaxID=120794 RepID=UPI001886872D|nr:uncharacterized protein LOC119152925 [Falco rusticolus]
MPTPRSISRMNMPFRKSSHDSSLLPASHPGGERHSCFPPVYARQGGFPFTTSHLQEGGHTLQPPVLSRNHQTTQQGHHMAKNSSATSEQNPLPSETKAQGPGTQTSMKQAPKSSGNPGQSSLREIPTCNQSSKKAEKAWRNHSSQALSLHPDEELFFPAAHHMSSPCLFLQAGTHCQNNTPRTLVPMNSIINVSHASLSQTNATKGRPQRFGYEIPSMLNTSTPRNALGSSPSVLLPSAHAVPASSRSRKKSRWRCFAVQTYRHYDPGHIWLTQHEGTTTEREQKYSISNTASLGTRNSPVEFVVASSGKETFSGQASWL